MNYYNESILRQWLTEQSYCGTLLSVAITTLWPKAVQGRNSLSHLTAYSSSCRKTEPGTEAETWRNSAYWLSLCGLLSLLSSVMQDDPHRAINHQSRTPARPQASLIEAIPPERFPLPKWLQFESSWQKLTQHLHQPWGLFTIKAGIINPNSLYCS